MLDPPSENPDSQPPEPAPAGIGNLSEKLKGRTTDLLAVAILAVGLLAVGAKVGRWWKQSPEDLADARSHAPEMSPWYENTGVSFEFGSLDYAIHHQNITGDADAAAEQLEQIAIAQLANVSLPITPPAAAEERLLAELKNIPVSRVLSTGESLYRFGPGLPMVILTKPIATNQESHRVVCWARAFPQSANEWMVFLFYPAQAGGGRFAGQSSLPLPAGCQRIQSLKNNAQRQSWQGFRGPGPAEDWMRHFDDWFEEHYWRPFHSWSKSESTWAATFQSADAGQQAEIWLHRKANGEWEGMVYSAPIPANK